MTTICLGLGGCKKHTHTTDKLFLQVQTSIGGAEAPSASTPPSAESDPASNGDTVGGSPPRRKMSAPRLGHRRQGFLQKPGPSKRSLPENDADREGVQGIGERKIRSSTNQYRGGERSCRFVYGGIGSYFYPATER